MSNTNLSNYGSVVNTSGVNNGNLSSSSNANVNTNQMPNGNTSLANNNNNDANPRTLYVGNLDPQVSEELILALFSSMGAVNGCKIIHEPGNDPYCFVEFVDHQAAATALLSMNKRQCLGRELKVNWATSPGAAGPKQDTSKHFHIFVGDLSGDIETQQLRETFAPFGEISDCRVVRDPQTLKSKGYGFVSFVKKEDAENAIATMNNTWLGSRPIRTNWATRKPPSGRTGGDTIGATGAGLISNNSGNGKQLSFEDVYAQSSINNCTVYCGGIIQGLCEELIQKTFIPFGAIQEIRVFKDKGYAFVKFASKEAATNAIISIHNSDVNGQTVKCSWGKETGDPSNQAQNAAAVANAAVAAAQYSYPYQSMGYWYAPATNYAQQIQAAAAAGGHFGSPATVQTAASYPHYNAYYAATGGAGGNFNPAAAAAAMQIAWQQQNAAAAAGVPPPNGQAPSGANSGHGVHPGGGQAHHLAAAGHQSGLGQSLQQQTATMIGAYSMQPYQAQ